MKQAAKTRAGPHGHADVDHIKGLIDPVAYISKFVELKPSGKAFSGRCPFHEDKTPSFNVFPDGGFKCFGCPAKGSDILDFIQQHENLGFYDALKRAAEEAGVTLESRNQATGKEKDLWAALQEVAEFYQGSINYFRDTAESFFKSRGISEMGVKAHRLGFASGKPLNLEPLSRYYGYEVLEELGVVRRGDNGERYSMFRNRIIFPVMNRSGNVVSLVGRAIDNSAKAKYLTLNTPFFKRSESLYGIHTVKKPNEAVYLAEGPIDAVLVNQQLHGQVVAPLGTEVTPAQIGAIVPKCERLEVLVDGDCAGRKAAVQLARSMPAHLTRPVDVGFWTFPEKEDPASWLCDHPNLDGLQRKPIDQVLISSAKHLFDMNSYIGKARAAEWLGENMPPAPAGPAVEVLRHRLAEALAIPVEGLTRTMEADG